MDECLDVWTDGRTDGGRTGGRTDGRTNGRTDGRMDGWREICSYHRHALLVNIHCNYNNTISA